MGKPLSPPKKYGSLVGWDWTQNLLDAGPVSYKIKQIKKNP